VTREVEDAVAGAFRDEWGRVVAALIRTTGDWDLAEECTSEAFARALERWPADGVPRSPGAWLTTTARNAALDRLRRTSVGARKVEEVAVAERQDDEGHHRAADHDGAVTDDRLRLLYTCCHPALAVDLQVALTLRTLAGLTTAEIARAFLVPEATMAKRLVRAKGKIRRAGIPYRVPAADQLAARTEGVLGVVYLLFNEGYSASAGADVLREQLSAEAIRLARLLVELLPAQPEPAGLLALLLLQDSRRAARVDDAGDLVPLEEQDRSRWDLDRLAEGITVLDAALAHGRAGPYQLQAAIAACHGLAPRACDTDWTEIARLYGELATLVPTPVVELNRAVAVAMADGPEAGLELVARLEARGELDGFHLLPATRADLLRRLGRRSEAAVAYREALAKATAEPDRRFLERRLADLG
jgi:RNA polymerase sigma-70 factor (ECF subfamily)